MIGVGTDLVDVVRFRRMIERRPGLVDRLFGPAEREAMALRTDPAMGFAARFAAKEATMKALGVGLGAFDFAEVEVVRTPSGAPELRLHGRAAALAATAGVVRWHVSLSHIDTVASAVVVAE